MCQNPVRCALVARLCGSRSNFLFYFFAAFRNCFKVEGNSLILKVLFKQHVFEILRKLYQ